MRALPIAMLSLLLCSCGATLLTKSVTEIYDNKGTEDHTDDRLIVIEGRPDMKIEYTEKKGGLIEVKIDNKGREGFTERLGDAAIDALRDTDLYLGAGGTAKGSDD